MHRIPPWGRGESERELAPRVARPARCREVVSSSPPRRRDKPKRADRGRCLLRLPCKWRDRAMASRVERTEHGRHQGSGMRRRCVRDGRVHDGVRRRHRSVVPAHLRRRNGPRAPQGCAILLPSVEVCIQHVATRPDHGFTDEAATRKMHAELVRARVEDRHVLRNPSGVAGRRCRDHRVGSPGR